MNKKSIVHNLRLVIPVVDKTGALKIWLHHSVRSFMGRWLSELCATFPTKVRCRVVIYFLVLGISKNLLGLHLYFQSEWR